MKCLLRALCANLLWAGLALAQTADDMPAAQTADLRNQTVPARSTPAVPPRPVAESERAVKKKNELEAELPTLDRQTPTVQPRPRTVIVRQSTPYGIVERVVTVWDFSPEAVPVDNNVPIPRGVNAQGQATQGQACPCPPPVMNRAAIGNFNEVGNGPCGQHSLLNNRGGIFAGAPCTQQAPCGCGPCGNTMPKYSFIGPRFDNALNTEGYGCPPVFEPTSLDRTEGCVEPIAAECGGCGCHRCGGLFRHGLGCMAGGILCEGPGCGQTPDSAGIADLRYLFCSEGNVLKSDALFTTQWGIEYSHKLQFFADNDDEKADLQGFNAEFTGKKFVDGTPLHLVFQYEDWSDLDGVFRVGAGVGIHRLLPALACHGIHFDVNLYATSDESAAEIEYEWYVPLFGQNVYYRGWADQDIMASDAVRATEWEVSNQIGVHLLAGIHAIAEHHYNTRMVGNEGEWLYGVQWMVWFK
jgi:hypothetical protein